MYEGVTKTAERSFKWLNHFLFLKAYDKTVVKLVLLGYEPELEAKINAFEHAIQCLLAKLWYFTCSVMNYLLALQYQRMY